jgi:hypothetical protein
MPAKKTTPRKKPAKPDPQISPERIWEGIANLRAFREEIKAASTDDADARQLALGVWIGYPIQWYGTPETLHDDVVALHEAVTDYLIRLADANGISEGPALHHAGVVCRSLFRHDELWNLDAESRACPTWPECLGQRRYALPQGQQDAIEAGERIIQRLRLQLGLVSGKETEIPQSHLSKVVSPKEAGAMYTVSAKTFVQWVQDGRIRAKKLSTKAYQIHVDDLPKVTGR